MAKQLMAVIYRKSCAGFPNNLPRCLAARDESASPEEINGWFAFVTVPPAPPFPEQFHLQKMCAIVWCYSGALLPSVLDQTFRDVLS